MKLKFKMNYLHKIYNRSHKVSHKEKKQILNEFCKVCNYNRKYAIYLLNAPLKIKKSIHKSRKPNYKYSPQTIDILTQIWKAAGFIWSKRLKAIIHLWLPWAKKRFHISKKTEIQLLTISSSTMDRRLKHKKIIQRSESTALPNQELYSNIKSLLKLIIGTSKHVVSWKLI